MADRPPPWQQEFLDRHRLPQEYLQHAQLWFDPLVDALKSHYHGADSDNRRPLLIAVNGCQGSGKTTVCDYLAEALAEALAGQYGLHAVPMSLDDFYLTHDQRAQLAARVHPLLATRGVPGTHDMGLLQHTLDALLQRQTPVAIPRFDKASDDRAPASTWAQLDTALDIVLLEGWCLGARPQQEAELTQPVNDLERDEDAQGSWRRHVNAALEEEFLPLYERVDRWVMLQAPSFACVYRWRLEQEQKLADRSSGGATRIMNEAQVARFIQHFQRLTENCLTVLPQRVDYLYQLDEQRRIVSGRLDGRGNP